VAHFLIPLYISATSWYIYDTFGSNCGIITIVLAGRVSHGRLLLFARFEFSGSSRSLKFLNLNHYE